MTTTTAPPTHDTRPALRAGPVCDHCRTAQSPAGWFAAEDGAQVCQRCWQAMQAVQLPCPTCMRPSRQAARS
jgi:hypothetical protein